MKKALALILTVAMLLSTVAIGASAARVVTEVPGAVDNAWYAIGENYNVGFDCMVGGDFIYELVVMSEADGNNGQAAEYNPTMGYGPKLNFKTGEVGYGDFWATGGDYYMIDGGLKTDVWTTVRYEVSGNDTAIYVDGAHVGTITADKAMKAVVANTNYGTLVGSIKISKANGDVVFYEDFESGNIPSDATGGSIEAIVVSEASFKNENVAKKTINAWYAVGENYNVGFDCMVGGDFIYELVVMSEADANNGKAAEYNPTMGYGPKLNFQTGEVGYGDFWATGGDYYMIDGGLKTDVWTTVRYEVSGNDTAIYVDDAYVGTITADKSMKAVVANTNYGTLVDSIKISKPDGTVVYSVDFEDGNIPSDATGGSIETFTLEGARYDLGNKYWLCEYYFDPGFNLSGNETVSFDFMFDSEENADGNSTAVFISGFNMSADSDVIGVNGKTVSCKIDSDVWYHAEFVADGAKTAIYLDGAYVGTVDAVMTDLCLNCYGLCLDNIDFGGNTEDFEDGNFDKKGDCSGFVLDYEFEIEEEVDPITLLPNPVAEGDAQLIETTGDYASLHVSYNDINITNNKVIYNFDLAIVPNDGTMTDAANSAWFEIWSDIASRRYIIGTTAVGVDSQQTLIEWGEATKDNFHDVVVYVNGRTVYIYLDRVLVYEGAAGNHTAIGNATIFAAMNCSVVLDNFKMYNGVDFTEIKTFAPDFNWNNNGGEWNKDVVTVGADCASIGHIYGSTVRTIKETCYSLGEDTIYCGNCGATMYTETVGMVSHKFEKYDINRVDDNGLIYSNCSASGCVERMYVTPADADSYTGKMHAFFDMSDSLFAEINREYSPYFIGDAMAYENGVAIMNANTYLQNYTEFKPTDLFAGSMKNNDFSITFDWTYDGVFDTDDTVTGNYNHLFEFCFGGDSQFIGRVGYDATRGVFYSTPWSGTAFGTYEEAYEMIEGETYNISISLEWNYLTEEELDEGEIEPFLALLIKVNDEVVLEYSTDVDPDEAYYSYTASEVKNMSLMFVRDFGVAYKMDNLVFGTADFAWTNRTYVGDVDGDNALTANDALCMRKFLAKVIDDSALAVSRMDANGDGAINAKDQLTIRKALVA